MADTVSESPILENSGHLLLTDTPKYKRRRVSAVRDFPPGCGPNAPQANSIGNIAICSSENVKDADHADIGTKKEKSESFVSDPSENCPSITCVDKTPYVSIKGEQPNHMPAEFSLSKTLEVEKEFVIQESSNGMQDSSEDLTKVKQEITTGASNGKHEVIPKVTVDIVVTEEKTVVEEISLPYHPIPSTIVWKERIFPPRRRVSCVRDFPAGCGTDPPLVENINSNDRLKIEEVQDSVLDDCVQAQPEPEKDDFREENMQVVVAEVQSNEGEMQEELKPVDDGKVEREASEGKDCKEIIVYRKDKGERKRATIFPGSSTVSAKRAEKTVCSNLNEGLVIVYALMAPSNSQLKQGCGAGKASSSASPAKVKRQKKSIADKQKRSKLGDAEKMDKDRMDKTRSSVQDTSVVQGEIATWDERKSPEEQKCNTLVVQSSCYDVNLPPFGASISTDRGARGKVRETLRLFQVVLRKLLQEHETRPKEERNPKARIDLQASKILKSKGKYINTGAQIVGTVPGVEVGDEFHYRVELMMIGLHRQSQGGIDCAKVDGKVIATSIVASGGYDNDVDNSDVLTFSGQGGNVTDKDKKPEDQKLERGNLGLKNSIDERNFVRVIRGVKETKPFEVEGRPKVTVTYTYDGLYTVERYWQEIGQHGNKVYKFELKRLPDQPELAWKEVKKSKKHKLREGRCIDDISEGKERFPISAINTLDDEKPPLFTNGGEIPYNFDGAIVEAKPLVFECGPLCKCPNSCHNRVTQHGIRFQLEIFKTRNRGWGVRSLSSIPSGSFICEYIGELLEDKEAEKRTFDEYLFDIGQDHNEHSLEKLQLLGFTIDAAEYGNVGSCGYLD
ncbi:hypothetical protein V2J09_020682 [Rumex salicifolius]